MSICIYNAEFPKDCIRFPFFLLGNNICVTQIVIIRAQLSSTRQRSVSDEDVLLRTSSEKSR